MLTTGKQPVVEGSVIRSLSVYPIRLAALSCVEVAIIVSYEVADIVEK
jgi:hypothetical protein